MITTFAMIAMQILISAEAGFVNLVQGTASVTAHQQVPAGTPIETQARSHAEVLLTPGSLLRLGQNSKVVLDSVDLTDVRFTVNAGEAVVESSNLDKKMPIHVKSGNLETVIVAPGLYRFSPDTAVVFEGRLQSADHSATAKKGTQMTAIAGKETVTPLSASFRYDELDAWSNQRANVLSQANTLALYGHSTGSYFPYSMSTPAIGFAGVGPGWIYSPFLDAYTFVPGYGYQSYYGYYYYSAPQFYQQVIPAAAAGGFGRQIPVNGRNGVLTNQTNRQTTTTAGVSRSSAPAVARPTTTTVSRAPAAPAGRSGGGAVRP